jgi:hypothetical protein
VGAALAAVSKEAGAELDTQTRALHELLALDRRLEDVVARDVPARLPPARHAFGIPATKRFRGPWDQAIERRNHVGASRILRRAIASLYRQMAKQTRSQQLLIERLRRRLRTPLEFSPDPARCAFCGGTNQPGIDSGTLFMCTECVLQAYAILGDVSRRQ